MSGKGTKRITKKVVKDEQVNDEVEKELSEEQELDEAIKKISDNKFETNDHEAPKAQETTNTQEKKSVTDFDHDEIRKLDAERTKTIDDLTLLKILIVRGKDGHNPALWSSSQRLLKQLNFEVDDDRRFRDSRRGRFNGVGRGGYQPRNNMQNQQDEVRQPFRGNQGRRDFRDNDEKPFRYEPRRGGYRHNNFENEQN